MTGRVVKTKTKKKTRSTSKLAPDIRRRLDSSEEPTQTPTEPSPTPMERDVSPYSDPELPRKLEEVDLTGGNRFWPSVVFGAQEEVGMRLIQRADQFVEQWTTIYTEHEKARLNEALPHIERQLQKAHDARATLEDTEENNRVEDNAKRRQVIQQRIEILETALADSKFEPERENLRGVINEYRSGRLGYVKHYTLFWAGKPVDTADAYIDFSKDRKERLDRYAREHGPHWLYFESPLWSRAESKPRLALCAILTDDQGFWKREGWVNRVTEANRIKMPPEMEPGMPLAPLVTEEGKVYVGGTGPKLRFRSLLDSGATYPSLFQEDLEGLGIDTTSYAAQSIVSLATGKGLLSSRTYELFVEVLKEDGFSLADPLLNPHLPSYIGSPCPVVMIPGVFSGGIDENGYTVPDRVSGILPLLAPYVTSVPGRNALLMGETRNDVVGAPKFPPERRWAVVHPQRLTHDVTSWERFDDPLITFSHNAGMVVDRDIKPGMSEIRVNAGMEDEKYLVRTAYGMHWEDKYRRPMPDFKLGPPE
ncbi:MAG: hypothetical protein M1839_006997 [Geoglossum umbratile]|nr:MAG: hypothetical protein M1839_006997 [Geoglossum umbratile]